MTLAGLRARLVPLLGLALFCAVVWLLYGALAHVRYRDVVEHLVALPGPALATAGLLTVLGYLALTGYDVLALRYIEKPVPYRRTAVASFVAYAVGHTLGQSWLTGGTVRYRLYAAWGLSAANVAAVVAFCAFTFWLGFLATGAVVFLAAPPAVPPEVPLPEWAMRAVGVAGAGATTAYLALGAVWRAPVRLFGLALTVPPWRQRVGQVVVAVVDWLFASATLYVLLPQAATIGYASFVGIYLVAILAGIASQVPGGLGVFEGAVVLALAPLAPASAVLGSLVAFRAIYFLAPLAAAALLLGAYEAARASSRLTGARRALSRTMPLVAPHVLTVTTFVAGAILLVSVATPGSPARLVRLGQVVPLGVIEAAHLVGSLCGAALLVLARGLQLRLEAAYRLTAAALTIGIATSLLKGLDVEEAALLAVMLAALLPSKRYFRRRASLASEAMSPAWIAAIGLALAGAAALGLFAYNEVHYSPALWRRVALDADASRSLRASAAVALLLAGLAVRRRLSAEPRAPWPPTRADLARAEPVVAAAPSTDAWLALLGDKGLLFSASGRGLVMYGVEGGSVVAMGDPVGPEAEVPELVWAFRELADAHGGWPVFYLVGPHHLPLYLDLGLTLLKLGEAVRVPLDGRVPGPPGDASPVEVVPAAAVAPLLPALREVSDAWLRQTTTRERRFAFAFFDERYLVRSPVAVVRDSGRVVAFANLRLGADRAEVAPDLVRARPDAPPGVVDHLLRGLAQWGRGQGYRWLNLGVAPLSAAPDLTLAPSWHRVGALLFGDGEALDRFRPHREPRYLAAPTGLALPLVLGDIAALVAGERRGLGGS